MESLMQNVAPNAKDDCSGRTQTQAIRCTALFSMQFYHLSVHQYVRIVNTCKSVQAYPNITCLVSKAHSIKLKHLQVQKLLKPDYLL